MPKNMLIMKSLLCSSIAMATSAQEISSIIQTGEITAEQHREDLVVESFETPAETKNRLVAEKTVEFEAPDPKLGVPSAIHLIAGLDINHSFKGMIGDGVPLDEMPERIWTENQMTLVVEVLDGSGTIIAEKKMPGSPAGCTGRGTCAFAHEGSANVEIEASLEPALLKGAQSIVLTVRVRSEGALTDHICLTGGEWDYCQIDQLSLSFQTSEPGLRLEYQYSHDPDHTEMLGASVVWETKTAGLPPLVIALIAGGLVIGMGLAAARRI